jgi:hypothetical protein
MLSNTSFNDYLIGKKAEYGKKFNSKDLAKKFVPYFESGQRIEIKTEYGEIKRGYVGVTTGWRPAFLLISRSNSLGSSELLSNKTEILKSINKYRFL